MSEVSQLTSPMGERNVRSAFDSELVAIADYVVSAQTFSDHAYTTAYWCLLDAIACALMASRFTACTRLLGPSFPGQSIERGARVPGFDYTLNPVEAAFNIGTLIRWLDFNDTWLAAEWGHPSDNFGAILAVADWVSQDRLVRGEQPYTLQDVLHTAIKAYEIQGVLALENSFNQQGLDHVLLVKLASTAVATQLFGGDHAQILNAISLAMVDGQSLRTYRHAPNTGSRKSWAAGDATARAVWLAQLARRGEMGYPSVLSTPTWGFYDVLMSGKSWSRPMDYQSYVMENILFKISYPAEFHGQTAVEAAIQLHPQVVSRLDEIKLIRIRTQASAIRIINKGGALHNPADRDHSLQYMVAIGLLFGELTAEHYEDAVAADPRIDPLRAKMHVIEDAQFSCDYLDPSKRSIANAIQIEWVDGSISDEVVIEYPLGHRQRREQGIPVLMSKFDRSVRAHYRPEQAAQILALCHDASRFAAMTVPDFMALLQKPAEF